MIQNAIKHESAMPNIAKMTPSLESQFMCPSPLERMEKQSAKPPKIGEKKTVKLKIRHKSPKTNPATLIALYFLLVSTSFLL